MKIGTSFLEVHYQLAEKLKLDTDHVIVDRKDYERILNWIWDNPEIESYILKNKRLKYDTNEIRQINKAIFL